jgi:hypothetical protein
MAVAAHVERPRFALLLAAMFLELLLVPVFAVVVGGLQVERVLMGIVLLTAVAVTGFRFLALGLLLPALVAQMVSTTSDVFAVHVAAALLRTAFLCYVVAVVGLHVLRDRRITLDTLAAAACTYMLLALVWANLFLLLELFRPGSFVVPDAWRLGQSRDPTAALAYFSLETLTTVTYGVIHPAGLPAGALCVCEALVGQLYLAIMIARLVGIHIAQRGA